MKTVLIANKLMEIVDGTKVKTVAEKVAWKKSNAKAIYYIYCFGRFSIG